MKSTSLILARQFPLCSILFNERFSAIDGFVRSGKREKTMKIKKKIDEVSTHMERVHLAAVPQIVLRGLNHSSAFSISDSAFCSRAMEVL